MIESHCFRYTRPMVIGPTALLVSWLLLSNVFAQSEEIEKPTLFRYLVPQETWTTPIKRGAQSVYQWEVFKKTLPLFGYNLSKIYFNKKSLCAVSNARQYSEYDLEKAALVHHGDVYDGFVLGGRVHSETLQKLAERVAKQNVLKAAGFDIGTEFQEAKMTIADFSEGFAKQRNATTDIVENAGQYFSSKWIPVSPEAMELMSQMIAKAKGSRTTFQKHDDLSRFWIKKADEVSREVTHHTDRSKKMLQYLANATRKQDGKPGLTVNRICASHRFIASHQDVLGNSLILATKRPLRRFRSDVRLIGPHERAAGAKGERFR